MYANVDTRNPTAVEVEVQAAYSAMFPDANKLFVPQIFGWVIDCFSGGYDGYQQIDALYHDFEHTLQGALCMARILKSRHLANTQPPLSRRMFELGMLAILLHDTGYLKKNEDVSGTGAKYTAVHVRRSAEFSQELLRKKDFKAEEILAIQNMILCTGINAALDRIPFQNEVEKIVGFALGTADLLGQMAADDYVDKLPVLYDEFAEAARFEAGKGTAVWLFSSVEDLKHKTPGFWDNYVRAKLDRDFIGLYHFLNDPYPSGRNYYIDRIEANLDRLRGELAGPNGGVLSPS